ncbi:site-specific DNA recombinase [Inquilinus ginsengisoli]|uniref:recombinase family protein n=1 Tax=Inquilinus ginsengisoli TaxID=363840 RepID=UPI003D1C40B1
MRCAIYTRKSADEATEVQFSTLEAQRELCESYIASQAGEGWLALTARYDDGGYSGGNLNRPALQQLLADVAAHRIDVVVVYKIDRLSRSLRDFVNLVALFESHGVTFVAVTQSFNTTTSMGRLTLNVLLSFAQFEREITGERLRDWFAGARARGMWLSGPAPYGYHVEQRRLVVNEAQAKVVRYIFGAYPDIGSARLLANEVNARGHLNKFGRPFTKRVIVTILQNRLYRGDLVHRGQVLPGQHQAVVSDAAWRRAQMAIAESARRKAALRRPPVNGMLKGLLFDATGRRLIHAFVHRKGRAYRYYVPRITRYGPATTPSDRFRAVDVEAAVVELLNRITGVQHERHDEFAATGQVRRMVSRIDMSADSMRITLSTGAVLETAHSGKLDSQPKSRGVPPWLDEARALLKGGHSKISAARQLGVIPSRFYRAMEKYMRTPT